MENNLYLDIETTGLNWTKHRITCIGIKHQGKTEVFIDESEEIVLTNFFYFFKFNIGNISQIVTKNGEMFDIPFIVARYLLKCGDNEIYDTFMNFKHFDIHLITKGWVKLDDMAKILKIEGKSGNGLKAIALWHANRYEELIEYNKQDLEVLEQVYLRVK